VQFGAHLDLARAGAYLPRRVLPFGEIAGGLVLEGSVARDTADDATPKVELTARTEGLHLVGREDSASSTGAQGTSASPAPAQGSVGGAAAAPWRLDGVDPTVFVAVDGTTGATKVQAQLADPRGPLVTLDAESSSVPYAVLFSDQDPAEALRRTSFKARLALPRRSLDSFPAVLGMGMLTGEFEAHASWSGSAEQPIIDAAAEVTRGHGDPAVLAMPVDLALGAHYEAGRFDTNLRATALRRTVLDARAQVQVRASDVILGFGGRSVPWTAAGRATLDRLPLQSIPALDDRQLRGFASGEAVVDGLHEDARGRVRLSFDGLQVGEVPCKSSTVTAALEAGTFDASARLDQADGFLQARARAGARWGSALTPALDPTQPAEVSLSGKQFRAAFLLPFVSRWVSELDGRIDADARIEATPAEGAGGTPVVRPQGTLSLHDGTFELPSFGGEFHDAAATLTLAPDGLVRLDDAVARGSSGTLRAAASARIEGAALGGVRASIRVPSADPLPLIFNGVQLGSFDGDVAVQVERPGPDQAREVAVDVPSAHVQLPTASSSFDVQDLGDLDGVAVGVRREGARFVETPLDGAQSDVAGPQAVRRTPLHVGVHLGDVEISRGTDLDVRLEGRPSIALTDKTVVGGQIRILRGTIDVRGKPFSVDPSTITFVGSDPSNPQVVLTASWVAPDGTRIYADFVGPLKTAKPKLRSEPARHQSEILALILFGTVDQQSNTSTTGTAQLSTVGAAAGGAATQPLNKALQGLDRALGSLGVEGGVSTRIDTSQAIPRPEVEVQIARDISLQVAWVIGSPPISNPDTATVTLDWHFLRKWALETTVGDQGTSIVDLVWQHRY
jgi:translocation and assembly module TamB